MLARAGYSKGEKRREVGAGQICMGYPLGGGKEKARKGCGCYRCLRAVMRRLSRWIKRDYARRFSADKLPMGCCGG